MKDYDKYLNSLRKKPTQTRSKVIVDAVLGATTQVFSRLGVEHSTTNRIAEVAGVSIGSLYSFFTDKNSLLKAWLHKNRDENHQVIEKIMKENRDKNLPQLIEILVHHMVDTYFQKRVYLRVLFQHMWGLDIVEDLMQTRRFTSQFLAGDFKSHYPDQLATSENLEQKIYIILNAFMGVIQSVVIAEDPTVTNDQVKKELSQLFVKQICKPL